MLDISADEERLLSSVPSCLIIWGRKESSSTVMIVEEMTMPLTNCYVQESRPCTPPGQQCSAARESTSLPQGLRMGEPAG